MILHGNTNEYKFDDDEHHHDKNRNNSGDDGHDDEDYNFTTQSGEDVCFSQLRPILLMMLINIMKYDVFVTAGTKI